jgi:hypothetical protein
MCGYLSSVAGDFEFIQINVAAFIGIPHSGAKSRAIYSQILHLKSLLITQQYHLLAQDLATLSPHRDRNMITGEICSRPA